MEIVYRVESLNEALRARAFAPYLGEYDLRHRFSFSLGIDGANIDLVEMSLRGALETKWTILTSNRNKRTKNQYRTLEFVDSDRGICLEIMIDDNHVSLGLFAGRADLAEQASAELEKELQTALEAHLRTKSKGDQVFSNFWYDTGQGGYANRTDYLSCPSFDSIKENYPEVQSQLEGLLRLERPDEVGKIILWNGPPGTGKTTAIRSLMRAWPDMLPHIITDAERFFGNPKNLYQVLLGENEFYEDGEVLKYRGNLIILEDAADFVMVRSRERHSFDVARLLNTADGLIGQGSKVVFLLTTNEDLGEIDPAVIRPGRCLQQLEFPAMSAEQATAWARKKGREVEFDGPTTLAEAYAALNPQSLSKIQDEVVLGFS